MKSHPEFRRVFLIVADSAGIGEEPDAALYGDVGSSTIAHAAAAIGGFTAPAMGSLGLGELAPILGVPPVTSHPQAYALRMREASKGKDTMTGHWEMMGILTTKPFLTFTEHGFPSELITLLEEKTGHKIIGNYASSGTVILTVLGEEQMRDDSLIVYTSADSVLQIAAHEKTTGLPELYRCCEIARELCLAPQWRVGRVIARPFLGTDKTNFHRTPNRRDFALKPPEKSDLELLQEAGLRTYAIGKINDIFDGAGVSEAVHTISNEDGMDKTIAALRDPAWQGLVFTNLVEFDSEYGHRRNAPGYAHALEAFDKRVAEMLPLLKEDDLLLITADHGNDPTFQGTDHTREKIPLLAYSPGFKKGRYLEERATFADLGATLLKNFGIRKHAPLIGKPIEEILEK